jgi:hypothetical protein
MFLFGFVRRAKLVNAVLAEVEEDCSGHDSLSMLREQHRPTPFAEQEPFDIPEK